MQLCADFTQPLAPQQAVGPERAQGYMRRVVAAATAMLTERLFPCIVPVFLLLKEYREWTGTCSHVPLPRRWGTATLAPLDLCPPGMALVQLPCGGREMPSAGHATSADAKRLQVNCGRLTDAKPGTKRSRSCHHKAISKAPANNNSLLGLLWKDFLHQAGVEVPIKCIANTLYVRISAHVYNEESDFLLLAQAVDEYRQTSLQHHPDGPPV